MALKIGFLTTLGRNVGDEFIREGIRAALDRTGVAYTPLYINKHDPKSLSESAEDESIRVANKYWASDIFIQSGAPVYWHLNNGTATSLNSEWHQWMWEDCILADPPDSAHRHPIFLNLGAGSCQPFGDDATTFLQDAACVDFARRANERAQFTSVRDPVAHDLLARLGLPHASLPCPAFFAAARHRLTSPAAGHIGLNLMPLGGHFQLDPKFDASRWETDMQELCDRLRQLGHLLFIAHDDGEGDWMERFANAEERIFLSPAWRDYLDVYSGCAAVVANRVHGAVCASGFGVPSLILGNDTRAGIGEAFGLSIRGSGRTRPAEIASIAEDLLAGRESRSPELQNRRDVALAELVALLTPIVHAANARDSVNRTHSRPQNPGASKALQSSATKAEDE